ncbi:MAG: LytR/AlgR family response regulator transcription factor [Crocinitomicaceae bacterium]
MKIVIIEDEKFIADSLEAEILEIDPSFEIIKKLGSISEALSYFETNPSPDLFFSDIQLADGISFTFFEKVKLSVPVIFCTAYDSYALAAFKAHGIDYILKPFSKKSIEAALYKYEQLVNKEDSISFDMKKLSSMMEEFKTKQSGAILVHKKDLILPIQIADVALINVENNVTYIYTLKNRKFATDKSLATIESILSEEFFQLNRQSIINRKVVKHAAQYFGRKLKIHLTLTDIDINLIVPKARVKNFLSWLENSSI